MMVYSSVMDLDSVRPGAFCLTGSGKIIPDPDLKTESEINGMTKVPGDTV